MVDSFDASFDSDCFLELYNEEELFPSTPGKIKIDRVHRNMMNQTFHRCFASTSTMFFWALFVIALTSSYLSFKGFIASGRRYLQHTTSWSHGGGIGGIDWEKIVML
ncbi:hypothetical protein L6452_15813 [Arctium lappa]|uniref:Uncharacterized protein n=1 Tax=Arctium lappa TaxID=4217 RepID=A0ACB9CPM4_ARCLA|nr:hypothetical protein L6452_15813 [Arctium lappa]